MMQTLQEIKREIKKNNPKIRGKTLNMVAEQDLEVQREKQIKEWQNVVEQIPTDILLSQLIDNITEDWIFIKAGKYKIDFADDDMSEFIRAIEKMSPTLDQLYKLEKVKRLGWFKA